jgi:hypothetical protein
MSKMASFRDFLKEGTIDDDVRKILSDSPLVLLGVTAAAAADLANLKINTVLDLGTSPVFGSASQLAGIDKGLSGIIARFSQTLENDIDVHAITPVELANSEISILAGIDPALVSTLETDLGIKSVSDMALWAPYTAARSIISEAFVGPTSDEVPVSLVPGVDQGFAIPQNVVGLLDSLPAAASLHPQPAFPTPTQDLSLWKDLINFLPGASVMQAIQQRSVQLQPISSAGDGSPVTLDYYPVQIQSLPSGYTIDNLFDEIRRDLTTNMNSSIGSFRYFSAIDAARNSPPKYSTSEGEDQTLWLGANPDDTLFSIFIPLITGLLSSVSPTTDGTVVCSYIDTDSWIFSTCSSYIDGTHPVAGNREFGYWSDPNLGLVIYTRGADRPFLPMWIDLIGTALAPLQPLPDDLLPLIFTTAFQGAYAFWTNFQQQVVKTSVSKGCSAEAKSPTVGHYDWDSVLAKYGAVPA